MQIKVIARRHVHAFNEDHAVELRWIGWTRDNHPAIVRIAGGENDAVSQCGRGVARCSALEEELFLHIATTGKVVGRFRCQLRVAVGEVGSGRQVCRNRSNDTRDALRCSERGEPDGCDYVETLSKRGRHGFKHHVYPPNFI
jgi:hypothetical protein